MPQVGQWCAVKWLTMVATRCDLALPQAKPNTKKKKINKAQQSPNGTAMHTICTQYSLSNVVLKTFAEFAQFLFLCAEVPHQKLKL